MTVGTNSVDALIDHEALVASRYRWWGVYLVREKRRLQGISEAVQAEAAQAIVRSEVLPDGTESPDALLTRVDSEIALSDAAAELEAEPDISETKPESDTPLKRRLSGRAAILRQPPTDEDEDF